MFDHKKFAHVFPFVSNLEEGVRNEFENACSARNIASGSLMADHGSSCRFMTFVMAGCVKVFMLSPEGREITLFRAVQGDCCIMSSACILSGRPFPALAAAEEAVTAVMLPSQAFIDFFGRSDALRRYVMGVYADRFDAMAMLLEEVTFNRMDKRLARFVVREERLGRLEMTHEAIACELGTAREVVSRLLGDFQRKGYVKLSRGTLLVENGAALRDLAGQE